MSSCTESLQLTGIRVHYAPALLTPQTRYWGHTPGPVTPHWWPVLNTEREHREQGNILNVHSVPWSNLCLAIWKGVNSDLTIHDYCFSVSWWSILKVWFGRYWWPGCGMWGEVISGSGHWERGRQRDEGPRQRERGVHSAMNNWNLSRNPDGAAAARKIRIDVFTRDFKVYLASICLLCCYSYIFQSVWWELSKCEKLHIVYYCAIF